MKQCIVSEQMEQELSVDARMKLLTWAVSKKYYGLVQATFSIGQMIEYLDENERFALMGEKLLHGEMAKVRIRTLEYPPEKLCDILWEECKDILSNS